VLKHKFNCCVQCREVWSGLWSKRTRNGVLALECSHGLWWGHLKDTIMLYCSFVLSALVFIMFQVVFLSSVSYLHFFNLRHLVKYVCGTDTVIWCGSFLAHWLMCGTIHWYLHLVSKMFPVSSHVFRIGNNESSGIFLPDVRVGKDKNGSKKCCVK